MAAVQVGRGMCDLGKSAGGELESNRRRLGRAGAMWCWPTASRACCSFVGAQGILRPGRWREAAQAGHRLLTPRPPSLPRPPLPSQALLTQVLTPVQSARYLLAGHPFTWNGLAFAHSLASTAAPGGA